LYNSAWLLVGWYRGGCGFRPITNQHEAVVAMELSRMQLLNLIPKNLLRPEGRLKRVTKELLQAIRACSEQRLFGPALILLYAGIDMMASLSRRPDAKHVERKDFLKWVEDYLLPNANLSCAPIDLWAARCGLIHSLSYDSSWTDRDEARRIRYVFDDSDAVKRGMRRLEEQDTSLVVVSFGGLLQAFETAVEGFLRDIESMPLALERINRELAFFPLQFGLR